MTSKILPEELIAYTFSFCPGDLPALVQVCKHWKSIIENEGNFLEYAYDRVLPGKVVEVVESYYDVYGEIQVKISLIASQLFCVYLPSHCSTVRINHEICLRICDKIPSEECVLEEGPLTRDAAEDMLKTTDWEVCGLDIEKLYRFHLVLDALSSCLPEYDHDQQNAIVKACYEVGSVKGLKLLREKGVDVLHPYRGEQRVTALHMACWRGHVPIVKYLLDVGVDPYEKIYAPETGYDSAIVFAVEFQRKDVIAYLIRRVPDILIRDAENLNIGDLSAVQHAKYLNHDGSYTELIDFLRPHYERVLASIPDANSFEDLLLLS